MERTLVKKGVMRVLCDVMSAVRLSRVHVVLCCVCASMSIIFCSLSLPLFYLTHSWSRDRTERTADTLNLKSNQIKPTIFSNASIDLSEYQVLHNTSRIILLQNDEHKFFLQFFKRLFAYQHVFLFIYLFIYLFIHLFFHIFIYLFI